MEFVEAINMDGGLLCVWDLEVLQENQVLNGDRWICIKGVLKETSLVCTIGFVYGTYNSSEKKRLWAKLIEARNNSAAPLLIMGDFNKVLKLEDRSSGSVLTRNMVDFGEQVNYMNLIDLLILGRKYTWRKENSCSRVHKVFVKPQWNESYPSIKLKGMKCSRIDHFPLLVEAIEIN